MYENVFIVLTMCNILAEAFHRSTIVVLGMAVLL